MIPVLGVPAISNQDLLWRMLASVDAPVGDFVFVDNSPDGLELPDCPFAERVWHLRMPSNLGVATSWNLIVKSTPHAPWWLIAPTDVVWEPGVLDRIARNVPTDGVLTDGGVVDWAWFALPEETVRRVGLFDEFFHPIYWEDRDYQRRLQLAGMDVHRLSSGVHHDNSSTIATGGYGSANGPTYRANTDYFREKWSGFVPGPSPCRGWDLTRRRQQAWDRPR